MYLFFVIMYKSTPFSASQSQRLYLSEGPCFGFGFAVEFIT